MNLYMTVPGYESLRSVLHRAYDQAARTKGAERHANNLPFHEQPMQAIAAKRGVGFLFGQADKKTEEAQGMYGRGETDKALHEMLGAINYIAGAIIFMEMEAKRRRDELNKEANTAQVNVGPSKDETVVVGLRETEGCGDPSCPGCYPQGNEVDDEALPEEVRALLNTLKDHFGGGAEIRMVRL